MSSTLYLCSSRPSRHCSSRRQPRCSRLNTARAGAPQRTAACSHAWAGVTGHACGTIRLSQQDDLWRPCTCVRQAVLRSADAKTHQACLGLSPFCGLVACVGSLPLAGTQPATCAGVPPCTPMSAWHIYLHLHFVPDACCVLRCGSFAC